MAHNEPPNGWTQKVIGTQPGDHATGIFLWATALQHVTMGLSDE